MIDRSYHWVWKAEEKLTPTRKWTVVKYTHITTVFRGNAVTESIRMELLGLLTKLVCLRCCILISKCNWFISEEGYLEFLVQISDMSFIGKCKLLCSIRNFPQQSEKSLDALVCFYPLTLDVIRTVTTFVIRKPYNG